jgi:hypothetical protein
MRATETMGGTHLVRPINLFGRRQSAPRTTQGKLDSERGGEKQVDLACFHLLEISRRNIGFFGKFILRHIPAQSLAPHVHAEGLDSRPFFSGQCHGDITPPVRRNQERYIYREILENILKDLQICSV